MENNTDDIPASDTVDVSDVVAFKCPNCDDISQDDVIFLCNKCEQDELVFEDGLYMCPACLAPGENFQCMLCDSKQVSMSKKKE